MKLFDVHYYCSGPIRKARVVSESDDNIGLMFNNWYERIYGGKPVVIDIEFLCDIEEGLVLL